MKSIFAFKHTTGQWVLATALDILRGYGLIANVDRESYPEFGALTIESTDVDALKKGRDYLTDGAFGAFFTEILKGIVVPDEKL